MSVRHEEALDSIRREYENVVAALKQGRTSGGRGARGYPAYDPLKLDAAIATAGDAYLIDKCFKELKRRSTNSALHNKHKVSMHDLREMRNSYAHGVARSVFPTVPKTQATLAAFLAPFP